MQPLTAMRYRINKVYLANVDPSSSEAIRVFLGIERSIVALVASVNYQIQPGNRTNCQGAVAVAVVKGTVGTVQDDVPGEETP